MRKLLLFILLIAIGVTATAQSNTFDINVARPGAEIQPTMYGIFFEDINFAADGGLYAELIKNRSFEFPNHLAGWDVSGNVTILDDGPFERCPHFLRLAPTDHSAKSTMIQNHGFFGIGVKSGAEYRFSVWARCPKGGTATLRIDLADPSTADEDQSFATTEIKIIGSEWQKYTAILHPDKTLARATLRVWADRNTTTDVEHVSLFPTDTYRGVENGLRRDLAEALEQLHPGVFRFPGGCIVEGADLATRYQWKNTLGPVENRPLNENRWHYTFEYRYFPDYYQSYGLGFYEFFCLSEQIGASPLPVVSVGLSCQYQNDIRDEKRVHVALDDLDPYIQDCIDLIDFANADPDTNQWAKIRAEMGHPAPFELKYLAIGNEQWDYPDNPAFTSRLERFIKAIRDARPEVKLIGSTGPDSEGDKFDDLQKKMAELRCDLYDEHYYRNEAWFLDSINRHRYDSYPRTISVGSKGAMVKVPRVFAGEYACHGEGKKYNHFNAALMEAQFMTGFERNADLVHMATYAPLFAHVEGWQWRPDAIWFDNLSSFCSCSYYVQQIFATHCGHRVLPLTMNGRPVCGDSDQNGLSATASVDKDGTIIVKVVNISDSVQPITLNLLFKNSKHSRKLKGENIQGFTSIDVFTLHADDPDAENTIGNPKMIEPIVTHFNINGTVIPINVPAKSIVIYELKH